MASVLPDALVAGSAGVADVLAAQLPDDPIGCFDPVLHARVDLRILLEQLQRLGVLPLAGDQPAVSGQPRLAPFVGHRVDPIGLGLSGVVLPELDVGVRPVDELGQLTQRCSVGEHRQHGAGGEVGADPDHTRGIDPAAPHRLRHRVLQHLDVVVWDLERPVGREAHGACRTVDVERVLEHRVGVVVHRRRQLLAVVDPHNRRSARQRPEVDADHVARVWAHDHAVPDGCRRAGIQTRIVDGPRVAQS